MNSFRVESPEVMYADSTLAIVEQEDIEELKTLALLNASQRARLCTHLDVTDALHEMLIVHQRGAYVRPHKHIGKSESTHIIEGEVDLVLFDDAGAIERVIEMGSYESRKPFYYRMNSSVFHMLIVRSDVVIFHEATNGPFIANASCFASWAPATSETVEITKFVATVEHALKPLKISLPK
jgi:cupin fold WbuC family metalloprotein